MKRFLFFILQSSIFIGCATAQPLMRDVFAAMPDSVQPMVTKNNRLDCIDFIENNMEARVRNKADEFVTLEALTADYARFRTSDVSVMELKLLGKVLCVVTTAQTGEEGTSCRLEDSNIRFYTPEWLPLQAHTFKTPAVESFFTELTPETEAARRSLASFHPVKLQLSPEEVTLTATLQTSLLTTSEKEAVRDVLQPVVLRWNGTSFVQE